MSDPRQYAIEAMVAAIEAALPQGEELDRSEAVADAGTALDAIPPSVLARLAVARGGMEQCDGSSDDENVDYFCEAEFEHLDGPGGLGDLAQLRRQLSQRGWRIVPTEGPMQVLCPLHPAAGEQPDSEAGHE